MATGGGEVEEGDNRMCYFSSSGWRPTFDIWLRLGQFPDYAFVAVYRAGCERTMYISLLLQDFRSMRIRASRVETGKET